MSEFLLVIAVPLLWAVWELVALRRHRHRGHPAPRATPPGGARPPADAPAPPSAP